MVLRFLYLTMLVESIGDGDLPLVEHRAAQDGVLAAQHGAVQVDLGDDLLGAG